MRVFAAMCLMIAAVTHCAAEGLSEEGKKLYAAAVVLASASGTINGRIVVRSDIYAQFDPGYKTLDRIHFEKAGECLYAEIAEGSISDYSKTHVIDFSKLDGRWQENGTSLTLLGKPAAHCFEEGGRKGCWNGAYIPYSIRHDQLINDLRFLLRHGCGASADPEPY